MKFSCDSCGAQYMISDEKVGANGVKVRCKKCRGVIVVKRAPAPEAVAAASPAPPVQKEVGLDEELGQAFDAAFGGVAGGGPGAEGGAGSAESAAAATQLMSPEELARLATGQQITGEDRSQGNGATASPAAEPSPEWYVAIRDAQVGPLGPEAVKEKWEAGEISPETLVWRPGMADWGPLSNVPELAQLVAPVPRQKSSPKLERARYSEAKSPADARPANGSSGDVEWKPNAGGALAALANEEMSSFSRPEHEMKGPGSAASPVSRSSQALIDSINLPDGGVDPTGAIPLQIKGMDQAGEGALKRKSSVARDTAELRIRRNNRTIIVVAAAMLVLFGGGAAALYVMFNKKLEERTVPGGLGSETADARPAAEPPKAAPEPSPAKPPVAAEPAPEPAPPVAEAPPVPKPEPVARPVPARVVKPPPPPPARVARAEPTVKPPKKPDVRPGAVKAPEPSKPPPKKNPTDPLDNIGSSGGGDEVDDILNGKSGAKGGHIYVPPALGDDVAETVSNSQITEAVAGKISGLRRCVEQQKAADASLKGVLKMRWDIRPDGQAADVKCMSSEFAQQPFAQCITNVVKSIRFPKSKSGKDNVDFPFNF